MKIKNNLPYNVRLEWDNGSGFMENIEIPARSEKESNSYINKRDFDGYDGEDKVAIGWREGEYIPDNGPGDMDREPKTIFCRSFQKL
jgi:hypothetical protein